jgi:adenylate kinase
MRVVLFGPPGAGKGTQAGLMCGKYNLAHVSTGDILREAVAKGTKTGLEAKSFMDRGELVPDNVVIAIVKEKIREIGDDGFVLDGFPRTLAQAEALDAALDELELPLEHVFSLEVSDEELVRRLSGRRVCPKCGEPYHLVSKPPKVAGKCDKCGAELVHRADDQPDAIRNRLKVYSDQTRPLLGYYEAKGILNDIDAVGGIQDILARISGVLDR